ncbi:MAG: hypothetical protein ACOCUR_02750, partial [Nanoarchaeota archaeon]
MTQAEDENQEKYLSSNKIEEKNNSDGKVLEKYELQMNKIVVDITILQRPNDSVPEYSISIANITTTTKIILEKIREDFVSRIRTREIDLRDVADKEAIKKKFQDEMSK